MNLSRKAIRQLIVFVAFFVCVLVRYFLLGGADTAHAEPAPPWQNPHWPNYSMGYCPGGVGGFFIYYCDGERYPDGSYWHQVTSTYGPGGPPACVSLPPGEISPVPAPNGCGGTAGGLTGTGTIA
jgi:hypothetical protein